MNVIDLFSGVGGFSTGFINAGHKVILANEIDAEISKSYLINHPETLMINCDIKKFISEFDSQLLVHSRDQKKDIMQLKKDLSKIDLIIGGPPCQGFSMAGNRIRKNASFIEDPRNELFKYYFQIIQKFEPDIFVFENVVGILSMNGGGVVSEIEKLFQSKNNFKNGRYFIQKAVFNAADFGIPQKRKRLIIIGSKRNFNIEDLIENTIKNLPHERKKIFTKKVTVAEAISDLSFPESEHYGEKVSYLYKPQSLFQKRLRGTSDKKVHNHVFPSHSTVALDRIKRIKPGQNWKDLLERDQIKSVHSGAYGRLLWDDTAVTITTRFDTPSAGRFIHPSLHRTITIREAARIQSFPDNFQFLGSKSSICRQIGNAVPPQLAEFIGYLVSEL